MSKSELATLVNYAHLCMVINTETPVPKPAVNYEYLQALSTSMKSTPQQSLPSHVARLVLSDALERDDHCSLTLEPLTSYGACDVTPCGHVFSSVGTLDLCPLCRGVVHTFTRVEVPTAVKAKKQPKMRVGPKRACKLVK